MAAAGDGGEILATAETLAAAHERYELLETRTVELKGLSGPTELASIDWGATGRG